LVPFVPDLISRLDDTVEWNDIDPVYWEDADEPTTIDELRHVIYSAIKYVYFESADS
jgi:hypothetical protein